MAAIFDIQTGNQINQVAQKESPERELQHRLRAMPTGRDYRSMQRVYLLRRLTLIVVVLAVVFTLWQLAYVGFGPETWDAVPPAGALQTP